MAKRFLMKDILNPPQKVVHTGEKVFSTSCVLFSFETNEGYLLWPCSFPIFLPLWSASLSQYFHHICMFIHSICFPQDVFSCRWLYLSFLPSLCISVKNSNQLQQQRPVWYWFSMTVGPFTPLPHYVTILEQSLHPFVIFKLPVLQLKLAVRHATSVQPQRQRCLQSGWKAPELCYNGAETFLLCICHDRCIISV